MRNITSHIHIFFWTIVMGSSHGSKTLWKLSKFKFRSNFDGKHLLLTSSKTIILTIIDQLTVIEDERRVVRRCRDVTIIILFPREHQYLNILRPMYIFVYTWSLFLSNSLSFYLHCRMFAQTYSTARILIVHSIVHFFCWFFVCLFLLSHCYNTNSLQYIFVVTGMDSWSVWLLHPGCLGGPTCWSDLRAKESLRDDTGYT